MKKLLAALALTSAACAAPAFAADVGLSISLGEPGFYGQIDVGSADRPRLINSRPVVVQNRYRNLAPVYLRVPVAQQRNWKRYCDRYSACMRRCISCATTGTRRTMRRAIASNTATATGMTIITTTTVTMTVTTTTTTTRGTTAS